MAEAPRVRCCIEGCRRSWRADRIGGAEEVMCGRHYKADARLHRLLLECRRAWFALNRRWEKIRHLPGGQKQRKVYRALHTCRRRHDRRWAAIKANSQMLQNMGYWDKPKARPQKVVKSKRATIAEQLREIGL